MMTGWRFRAGVAIFVHGAWAVFPAISGGNGEAHE
jgi:hypothetical protein